MNNEVEQVLKEFEELGYENKPNAKYPHMIYLVDEDDVPQMVLTIFINTQTKRYWKHYGDYSLGSFSFEEHKLLTKLFKALGWFE